MMKLNKLNHNVKIKYVFVPIKIIGILINLDLN